jgi:arsenate reductase
MTDKRKVLILCTGNSCRSIMAEAMVNTYLSESWQAYSAGIAPSRINPRAIQVMSDIGIDISSYRSKSVEEFIDHHDLDLVITVCDNARETCPVFARPVEQIHIGFEDPAPYTGQADEIALLRFREIRDAIRYRLIDELKSRN